MASVYITLKIMPDGVDTDLDSVEASARKKIETFGGNIAKTEEVPVAFGLKSLNITFLMKEDKGDTEELENDISSSEGVQSVQVTDVRRAIG